MARESVLESNKTSWLFAHQTAALFNFLNLTSAFRWQPVCIGTCRETIVICQQTRIFQDILTALSL